MRELSHLRINVIFLRELKFQPGAFDGDAAARQSSDVCGLLQDFVRQLQSSLGRDHRNDSCRGLIASRAN